MKIPLYTLEGKEAGEIDASEKVFGLPWNEKLVAQVAYVQGMNRYFPWAHTKGSGEVAGSGKKPWRQKGTGRARHGFTRSPIWRGGGVTFGPRNEKNRSRAINVKMRRKAVLTVLSRKRADGELKVVDGVSAISSVKQANAFLKSFCSSGKSKIPATALIALDAKAKSGVKNFRNLSRAYAIEARNLNVLDLLNRKHILISSAAIPEITKTFSSSR